MDTFTGSKRAGHWDEAVTFPHSTLSVCMQICSLSDHLSLCFHSLDVAKRLVPFLLFTFSHSRPPPLCIPLFVPAALIDCLFISGPAAASALEDEIVMVIVIFCRGDKEGESHMQEIEFETYGGQDQDMVNILCFKAQ